MSPQDGPTTGADSSQNHHQHHGAQNTERQPLLLCGGRGWAQDRNWTQWFTAELDCKCADLVLILCYLITGLLDSVSISIRGSFVSMQTGRFGPSPNHT